MLVQIALVLAGGGERWLDIEFLRTGDDLFGAVPSDTTVARTIHEITPEKRAALVAVLAKVRTEVWRRSQATKGKDPVVLDIDASLVEIRSENNEQAAPTYKGGYGFHPMFCFVERPARCSRRFFGRATPGPTRWPTTSACSMPPSLNCPVTSSPDAGPVTRKSSCAEQWSCAPTRPDAPRTS